VQTPVGFDGSDVVIDLSSVQRVVLCNLLRKHSRMSELCAPLPDGFDVFIHALASFEDDRDLESDNADFKDALKDWVPASLFEGSNRKFDFGLNIMTAVVASLDLREIVGLCHAVHEPSDQIGSK